MAKISAGEYFLCVGYFCISISSNKFEADYYKLTETSTVSSFSVTVTTGNVLIWAELYILNLYILCVRKQLLAVNSLK